MRKKVDYDLGRKNIHLIRKQISIHKSVCIEKVSHTLQSCSTASGVFLLTHFFCSLHWAILTT